MSKRRSRRSPKHVYRALQLYFPGLSFRKTSQKLPQLIKRNHVSIRKWIQRYKPEKMLQTACKPSEFIIDKILIKVGNGYVCLSVAMEPTDKTILGIRTSIEKSRLVAHRFIQSMIREYGKRSISTDGGTWYPQACIFLNVEHHFHSFYQKSIIERTIQYMKDRTECFDGYFPCKKDNDYKLKRVMNWLDCFLDMHDRAVMEKIAKWPQPNCNNIKLLMRM